MSEIGEKFGNGRYIDYPLNRTGRGRRILIIGVPAGIALSASVAACGRDDGEQVYLRHLKNFETVSRGVPEAEDLYRFFAGARRRGRLDNNRLVQLQQSPNPNSVFYTAVVDQSAGFSGVMGAKLNQTPPYLLIKREDLVTDLWSGVITAYNASLFRERVRNGLFGGSRGLDAFVAASEMEFKLLDHASSGNFNQVTAQEAVRIGGELLQDPYDKVYPNFASLREPESTRDERNLRSSACGLAVMFKKIENDHPDPEEQKRLKGGYVAAYFQTPNVLQK